MVGGSNGVQSWRQVSVTSLHGFLATADEIPARWNLRGGCTYTRTPFEEWGPSARAQCELNLLLPYAPVAHHHHYHHYHHSITFSDSVARRSSFSVVALVCGSVSPSRFLSRRRPSFAANSRGRDHVVTSRQRERGEAGTTLVLFDPRLCRVRGDKHSWSIWSLTRRHTLSCLSLLKRLELDLSTLSTLSFPHAA